MQNRTAAMGIVAVLLRLLYKKYKAIAQNAGDLGLICWNHDRFVSRLLVRALSGSSGLGGW